MTEQASLHDLERMLDLIGPNMWLTLDEVGLVRYFGRQDPLTAASDFALEHGCFFLVDRPPVRFGRFGRAFYKPTEDIDGDS